jgi:hypothetical protein
MARLRSPNATVKTAPPPSDGLRENLDLLANRVVLRCLDASQAQPSEPELETQIQGLKTVGAYWGLTRKGNSPPDEKHKSAYTGYRRMLTGEDESHGPPN